MKLDILAIGAHPDDVELGAGGTLITHILKGYKCGILDLTKGELGTRGTAQTRTAEAEKASRILSLQIRENLSMQDGFFANDREHQLQIVEVIRKYCPEIILSNAIQDRHPDHSRAAELVTRAVFLAGLLKVKTNSEVDRWKVKAHYHYIQDRYSSPELVVDITDVWSRKMEAILAYSTQFYDPTSTEPQTEISTKDFLHFLEARAMEMGRPAGFRYAEGFNTARPPGVKDLFDLA